MEGCGNAAADRQILFIGATNRPEVSAHARPYCSHALVSVLLLSNTSGTEKVLCNALVQTSAHSESYASCTQLEGAVLKQPLRLEVQILP